MKFRRQPDRNCIGAVAGAILGIDMGIKRRRSGLRQLAGELANHEAFELDADIEGIARFLPARRRHHGDPIAAKFDKAFRGERDQRMTCDGAAHAKAFAERVFGKLLLRAPVPVR